MVTEGNSTVDRATGDENQRTENIADPFRDLLSELADGPRMGLVHQLAVGYYEGWRPTRTQVANLVARETGRMTEDEYLSLLRPHPSHHQLPQLSVKGLQLVPGAGKSPSAQETPDAGRATRVGPIPSRTHAFTVVCGQVMASYEFVARGLSSGGWVHRGNAMYRLISLHYELVPTAARGVGPREPPNFTAQITCVQDIPARSESTDGQTMVHAVSLGRVFGVRGPWPVSPAVRHLRFLIYPQASVPFEPSHHPAGALWVDLRTGQAHWRHIADRHTARSGPESIQEESSR